MGPLERVHNGDVDFRPVERPVLRIHLPRLAKVVQALCQCLLRIVPHLKIAHVLLRSRRQAKSQREPEHRVDGIEELQSRRGLLLDLLDGAEDVSVVLLETPDPREPSQSARQLVAMEHTEIGHTQGQLAPRSVAHVEHHAVAGAIHGFQRKRLLLRGEGEHVLGVVLPVARGLPQFAVVDVGRDHLLESSFPVLRAYEFHEGVVDVSSARLKEARSRRELVEEEQLLLLADLAMIALGRLLLELLPLLELLVVGEADAVDPLQHLGVRLALPIGRRVFGDLGRLDLASVPDVWAATNVDQRAASIDGGGRSGDFLVQNAQFELIVLEHLHQIFLSHLQSLERLLLLDDALEHRLEKRKVIVGDTLVHVAVVVEAILDGRAVAEASTVYPLERLAEDVSARVPEHLLRLAVVELEQLQAAVALQRPVQVPQYIVHLGDDRVVGQTLADALGHVVWSGAPRLTLHLLTVLQGDGYFDWRLGFQIGEVLRLQLVVHDNTVLNEIINYYN